MTVAELHGKLSRSGSNLHDRLEDLLTADVFGPLRYLPSGIESLRLLLPAIRVSPGATVPSGPAYELGEHPAVHTLLSTASDSRPMVSFWRKLRYSEPDMLLDWTLPGGGRLVAMVEVKYLSGKSGEGITEEDGEIAVSDQLGREYQDLCERLGPADHGVLIYLTAHHGLPADDLTASLATIRPDARVQLFWLSWIDVYRTVRRIRNTPGLPPWTDDLWEDIQHLLERKRLTGLRDWAEILPEGTARQQAGWYQARVRQTGYHWPAEHLPAAPQWYTTGATVVYRWPTKYRRSEEVLFYHAKGDSV